MTADGSDRSFGAPRFDVVLRGYDRRQVDEHLSRLQRLMGRMRGDLDTARSQLGPAPAGGRQRPTPRPRPDGSPPTGANDVVGTFTDRMHAILQSAEEEAAEIRNRARAAARADEEHAAGLRAAVRAEEDAARRTLADLVRQRDAVLAELTRVRGQLEGLLSGPTARITLPTQESGPERREVGAGQPLPSAAELFEPASAGEPVAAGGRGDHDRRVSRCVSRCVHGVTRRAGRLRGRSRRAAGPGRADPACRADDLDGAADRRARAGGGAGRVDAGSGAAGGRCRRSRPGRGRLGRGSRRGADSGRAGLARPLRLKDRGDPRGAQPAIRLSCADANGAIPSATYSRSST